MSLLLFLMKLDIADGLYEGWIRAQGLAHLWLVMSSDTQYGEPLISFPLSDPLGWVESPPFFTDLSETAEDLGNASLQSGVH